MPRNRGRDERAERQEPDVASRMKAPRPNARAPRISPSFPRIEAVSLTNRVIDAMKDAFFEGRLRPGDAIVEREVARLMKVGTPVVREALIALQGQGFVRRVTNTGTYVTQFDAEEVRQLYMVRIELETLAFQWARTRVTEQDLAELTRLVDQVVEAGERGDRRQFIERDFLFHRHCWKLSGNRFLAETLERVLAPLFPFVVVVSGAALSPSMAREHYDLVNALRSVPEPEFSALIRKTITGFAMRWLAKMASAPSDRT
jgi:DNA-binding GntR family transcriptional regulator